MRRISWKAWGKRVRNVRSNSILIRGLSSPENLVSYRIPERFGEMPFVGTILAVFEDHIEISPNDPSDPDRRMRGTLESRPVVSAAAALD